MRKSLTKKLTIFSIACFSIHFLFIFATSKNLHDNTNVSIATTAPINEEALVSDKKTSTLSVLYDSLELGKLSLSRQAFDLAVQGYEKLKAKGKIKNSNVLSIVDFSLPSSAKRLFILDVSHAKLLFHTYVSHGRNSGRENASSFSNAPESFKSSLGFYITKDTYIGKHGFSLRLDGQDKGYNDNALSRAIVMHNADYVNESLIRSQGYIGRSLGCPAVPAALHKPIIENIKNGSCLFVFGADKSYASHSTILNKLV